MRGALIPHAPLLLPEVTPSGDGLRDIWDALGRIRIPETATTTVIVLTPHSSSVGTYEKVVGSLEGFGVGVSAEFETASMGWDLPAIEGPLDHGALVPLLLLGVKAPVAVIGLGKASDMSDVSDIIGAIRMVAAEQEVYVIASAHTSARLTERAPLPYSFDAVRLEATFITEIEADCVAARGLADELWSVGDSCSRSSLSAFGELFAGAEGTVMAYGSPFGVGYPVVTAEIDV